MTRTRAVRTGASVESASSAWLGKSTVTTAIQIPASNAHLVFLTFQKPPCKKLPDMGFLCVISKSVLCVSIRNVNCLQGPKKCEIVNMQANAPIIEPGLPHVQTEGLCPIPTFCMGL